MRKLWFDEIFSKLTLRDAKAANQAVMCGLKPKWEAYSRESIGSHIEKIAHQMAYERREREEAAEAAQRSKHYQTSRGGIESDESMAFALRYVRQNFPGDKQGRRAWLNNYFGGSDADYPGYHGYEEFEDFS